jgi:anti-sigma factor RsiW
MMGDIPSDLDLMAYADGELDAPANERVRQYLLVNPKAATKVRVLRQLRDVSRRLCQSGPVVPAHLLSQIESLAQAPGAEELPEYDERGYPLRANAGDGNSQQSYPIGPATMTEAQPRLRIGFRFAAAAVLLIGLAGFLFWFNHDSRIQVVSGETLVPANWVVSTAQTHINCSKHADHFNSAFPHSVQELPASLHQYLGHDSLVPDLSKLGYQFAGAGPCKIPGGKTAHLLYRPKSGGNVTLYTVSLFVQPDTDQLPLEKGKVYFANDAVDHTPMIIWRGKGVVYYLVGEDKNQLSDAAKQMGMKIRI